MGPQRTSWRRPVVADMIVGGPIIRDLHMIVDTTIRHKRPIILLAVLNYGFIYRLCGIQKSSEEDMRNLRYSIFITHDFGNLLENSLWRVDAHLTEDDLKFLPYAIRCCFMQKEVYENDMHWNVNFRGRVDR